MRPALNKFVRDWLGDNPPREALDALHAAIRADREAALGHFLRRIKQEGSLPDPDTPHHWLVDHLDVNYTITECWDLPTGLEEEDVS